MKKIFVILIILLLLGGIVGGIYLLKRQQNIKSKASIDGTRIEVVDTSGNPISTTTSSAVKLRLTFVATASASPSHFPSESPTASSSAAILEQTPSPSLLASISPTLSPSPQASNIGIGDSASLGISTAFAQEVFPSQFRVANTPQNLPHAQEQLFNSNPKTIDWKLIGGNGSKTVYAQFKINNTWSQTYTYNITLTGQLSAFEMGIEAGAQSDTSKVEQVSQTKAAWVRLNFIVASSQTGVDDQNFINTYNSIIDAYIQKGIKIIGLIGAESVKQGYDRTNSGEFKNRFVEVADKITQTFGDRVKVFELFNEPNDWAGGNSAQVSPVNFADFLKAVYQRVKIERNRSDLTLLSGPLFSHNLSGGTSGDTGEDYLRETYTAGINQLGWQEFKNSYGGYPLDAIGYHIYVDQSSTQADIIQTSIRRNIQGIKTVLNEFDPEKNIWISEIGWGTGSVSEQGQADDLEVAMNVLKSDPVVRTGMWFTLRDFDNREYGLVRVNGNLKLAFQKFVSLATQLQPSIAPTPTPTISPSPIPTLSPTPNPTVSPTPNPSATLNPSPTASSSASPTSSPNSTSSPTASPSNGSSAKVGDFNNDGKINSFDSAALISRFNSKKSGDLAIYDLNGDHSINSFDFSILKSKF